MIAWLIGALLTHTHTALDQWACNLVNTQTESSDCYDWCRAHATFALYDGYIFDASTMSAQYVGDMRCPDESGTFDSNLGSDDLDCANLQVSLGLPADYSRDLRDACAVLFQRRKKNEDTNNGCL